MATITEVEENLNAITEEEQNVPEECHGEKSVKEAIPAVEIMLGETQTEEQVPQKTTTRQSPTQAIGRRSPLETAKATAISYGLPEQPSTPVKTPTRKKTPDIFETPRQNTAPLERTTESGQKLSAKDLYELQRNEGKPQLSKPSSRMDSRCSVHGVRGGQELCYLCHQRAEKNVPVYMHEERRRKELEQDRLLQEYQHQKDSEAILTEQTKNLENRKYNQKVASFNLGVAETVKKKKNVRPLEFSRSYLFHNRALTPPRCIKQKEYSNDLNGQVTVKNEKLRRLAQEQEFLERLEQVQLAEDLAMQREQYLREKKIANDLYKKALDTQVRFKPLPIPALEPDSIGPIFGIHDSTEEKLEDKRRRARHLYHDQLDMVAQKKRQAILNDLRNQKAECDMLDRTKNDIILDRSIRHQEQLGARRDLEKSWAQHVIAKKDREEEEVMRSLSPGMLIHEQCDKYHRCKQCGRRPHNCGESNVWSESRYIPGSRLIV